MRGVFLRSRSRLLCRTVGRCGDRPRAFLLLHSRKKARQVLELSSPCLSPELGRPKLQGVSRQLRPAAASVLDLMAQARVLAGCGDPLRHARGQWERQRRAALDDARAQGSSWGRRSTLRRLSLLGARSCNHSGRMRLDVRGVGVQRQRPAGEGVEPGHAGDDRENKTCPSGLCRATKPKSGTECCQGNLDLQTQRG